MKSKKLSIAVAIVWFLLTVGWYVFSAFKISRHSIFEPVRLSEMISFLVWIVVIPSLFWIPKKVLEKQGVWHRYGSVTFCILNAVSFLFLHIALCVILSDSKFQGTVVYFILDTFSTILLLSVHVIMFLVELLFMLFRKERLKTVANSEETAS